MCWLHAGFSKLLLLGLDLDLILVDSSFFTVKSTRFYHQSVLLPRTQMQYQCLAAGFDVVYPALWWSTSGSLAWDPSFKGDRGITVVVPTATNS